MKEKIISALKNKAFPDLGFLYSDEVLELTPKLLLELLEEEKEKFELFLKIPKSDITFDAFEDEDTLGYFWDVLNHFQSVNNTEKIRKIIDDFRPVYQDFGNYMAYHKGYFDMLVYCNTHCDLDQEQKRAITLRIKAFADRGIDLDTEKQERLKELNKRGAELSNTFSNNIVDDEAQFEYSITDIELIKNLPADVLDVAKKEAVEKKKEGYLFSADPTAYIAIMKYCSDASIRQDFEKARNAFASAGKYDNRKNILEIITVKQERAKLLGFKNYAELSLHNKMAETPDQIFELISGISDTAKIKAEAELEELKSYFSLTELNTYDVAFYTTKYKEEKYSLDDKETKKYFEYNHCLTYLHNLVNTFYGLELKEISASVYNPEVKVYEVYRNGELISYYMLDAFYRKEKRGGAWADNVRSKEYIQEYKKAPIIINVCNFQKSADATLLTMRDVETLFHEFGHAIHEMLSQSKYAELSGFGVEWDFVELPSQLLENWVTDRESLEKLASHFETSQGMPEQMLNTLDKLETFMSGGFVLRQNEFALLDMHLYAEETPKTVEELDEKILGLVNKYGLFTRDSEYKMYTSFGHIFGGGYAAGYYSYMWAEILEADVFAEIKKQGMFNPEVGARFVDTLLGQGTRKPASELFHDFMGREVSNEAFMKRKGL